MRTLEELFGTIRSILILMAIGAAGGSAALAQCETAKLTASDPEAGDWFGHAVAVSGDATVVGAYRDDVGGLWEAGSAHVFRLVGDTWSEEAVLTASDVSTGDWFGFSVAIDGDVIVVGAKADDDRGSASGSAYVFRFDGIGWVEEAKLTASDGARNDEFGHTVAVDNGKAVVGAPQNNLTGPGWAYVFRFDGGGWVEEAKLVASDGRAKDDFGLSVSISGDAALIGAWNVGNTGLSFPDGTGAAYVFRFDGIGWNQESKLVSAAPLPGERDRFGRSVSIRDNLALVGTEPITTGNPIAPSGSAYVFRFDGSAWTDEAKLVAADGEPGDRFGASVSIDGARALVGAWGEWSVDSTCSQDPPYGGVCNAGSAYVFQWEVGGAWNEAGKFTSSDAAEGDLFAWSVSLAGDTAVVGAWRDGDAGVDAGSAYVFDLACPHASATFRNSGSNPTSYAATTLPVLGTSYVGTVDLAGTTGHSLALLVGYATPLTFVLGAGQVILVNPADPAGELLAQPVLTGPVATYSIPIPADPSLAGLPAATQALHLGTIQPFALSNAQDLVLGL